MPVKSKAQYKFMSAVARGVIGTPGLSRDKATEMLESTEDPRSLPNRLTQSVSRYDGRRQAMKRLGLHKKDIYG